MKLFLGLKHWQIFLTFLVISYLTYFGIALPIVATILVVLASLWFFGVGVYSHNKLAPEDQMPHSIDFFRISCFLAPILWMASYWNAMLVQKATSPDKTGIYFIIALGAVAAALYMIWFTATVLHKSEPKHRQGFANKMLLMMWLLLLPIGIWFVQPKVNRLVNP